MCKDSFPAIKVVRKTGDEPFHLKGKSLGLDVRSFWSWTASDLAVNNLRGHLAEFLVASDLGLSDGIRDEWDTCDIRTSSGIRIEVKSASYIQSWNQKELSKIQFSIAPARGWDSNLQKRTDTFQRNSDVYVFCLHHHKDQTSFDPTDLSQWTFFVLSTHVLNENCGKQKKISLNPLLQLQPIECSYGNIKKNIEAMFNKRT